LFQSLFGAASAACSERRSERHSEGSTVKVNRLVELGLIEEQSLLQSSAALLLEMMG
jgi:hypothetical protein